LQLPPESYSLEKDVQLTCSIGYFGKVPLRPVAPILADAFAMKPFATADLH